ncbi:MAG: hypothetical protein PHD13_02110 [Methanocellales archaeon]|nr:hypothetical protein [Methanocellales archaeon]MDD3291070.1 hypothetical protein [Methanocellales archaeon]MDD5234955.1 hypothetical protein [Methanocellales archaeon]MDD5484674.1 hypothetical protein [Methanocellales archaeon]
MPTQKKTIKIEIKTKDDKKVPVTLAVDVFQRIQNILYSVSDHLKGNPFRPKGDFPSDVKEECSLVFSNIALGSMSAELQLSKSQMGLLGLDTCGEKALEKTNEIIETISIEDEPEEDLLKIIDSPKRLNRIVRELDQIWPEETAKYNISFAYKQRKRDFHPNRKPIIKFLLSHPIEEYEKEMQGRIIEFRVDHKRQFEIDTPEDIIKGKYSPEIEDYVIQHIGGLVQVRGLMSVVNKQHIFEIKDENAIEEINAIPIPNFLLDNKLVEFKQPLSIKIEFESEQYILSNDELKLLVIAKNIKDGLNEIKEELKDI